MMRGEVNHLPIDPSKVFSHEHDSSQSDLPNLEEIMGRKDLLDLSEQNRAVREVDLMNEALPYLDAPVKKYKPFEPGYELQFLRVPNSQEATMSRNERNESMRLRVELYRDALAQQNMVAAELVGELTNLIKASPGISAGELFAKVLQGAPVGRFAYPVFKGFSRAISDYRRKHTAVEKAYSKMNVGGLFIDCFGRAPIGKVEIIKGPMTLHFKIFDRGDYAAAFAGAIGQSGPTNQDSEIYNRAHRTAGLAFQSVRDDTLVGCVTVSNEALFISTSPVMKKVFEERTDYFDEGERIFFLQPGHSNIVVRVDGRSWEIRSKKMDDKSVRVNIVRQDSNRAKPIFEYEIPAPGKSGTEAEIVSCELKKNGTVYAIIEADRRTNFISVANVFGAGLAVDFSEENYVADYSYDVEKSREVYEHEQQHQLNKLFVPLEKRLVQRGLSAEAAPLDNWDELDTAAFIKDFVRIQRNIAGIDGNIREEILATYRAGNKSLTEIQAGLFEFPGYNFYERSKIDYGALILDKLRNIKGADLTEREGKITREQINLVFAQTGALYREDIEKWILAVEKFENKGYSRDDIVSLLSILPICTWSSESARMPDKNHAGGS